MNRSVGERPWISAAPGWRASASRAERRGAGHRGVTLTLGALDQNITQVSVSGRFQRVSPGEVEQAVKARVRDMGLLSVDLAAVRRAVEQLPWVDSATVERQWPRALNIRVVEQVAAARWGANGLLNTRGELFISEARHIPPELPRLSGPRGSEAEVARRYLAAQGQLIEAGMRLTAVRLDLRGAWEFDLDNGITVRLGRRQVDERFQRFVTAGVGQIASPCQRHRLRRHALHEWVCDRLASRRTARRERQSGG